MNRPFRVMAILFAGLSVLAQGPITATPLPPLPGTEPRAATLPPPPQSQNQPSQTRPEQPVTAQPMPSQPPAPQPPAPQPPAPQPDAAQQAPARQPVAGTWVARGAAVLQVLDKVNARHSAMTIKTGETTRFETLSIGVRGCVVRGPDQAPDAAAFVTVTDSLGAATPFSGWIVQSAPAASMLQHPIYDVRVAGCTP
jgi:hypothetical protein